MPAAVAIALAMTAPALATIDNSATANGRYGEQLVQSGPAVLELEVEPPRAALDVAQAVALDTAGGEDAENADGGDRLVLTVTVTNSGNIALTDIRPADVVVQTDGTAGTGSFASEPEIAAEIAPGASQRFEVAYTLSAEDVYRAAGSENGIAARVAVSGTGPAGEIGVEADNAIVAVAANPRLSIAKDAVIDKADGNLGEGLEAGDMVTYTYTVSNTGNVPIGGVSITDEHEDVVLNSAEAASAEEGPFDETASVDDPLGVSADESGTDGVWDVLGAGGAVTFTYRHTVTQAEFEAQ